MIVVILGSITIIISIIMVTTVAVFAIVIHVYTYLRVCRVASIDSEVEWLSGEHSTDGEAKRSHSGCEPLLSSTMEGSGSSESRVP